MHHMHKRVDAVVVLCVYLTVVIKKKVSVLVITITMLYLHLRLWAVVLYVWYGKWHGCGSVVQALGTYGRDILIEH